MAKSKKNSSHVSSVAKGQSLASSDGHIVEKENSILVTLKKILNIKVLGFIVAVATLAVTVWGIWFSESRVEKQKEKINNNVAMIESTFHPETLANEPMSTPDRQMVKDYQLSVLRMATYWKSIANLKPASAYKDLNATELMAVLSSQLETINSFNQEIDSINYKHIQLILEYGEKNKIPQYQPKIDQLHYISSTAGERDKVVREVKETTMKLVMSSIINSNNGSPQKKEMLNAFKTCEKLYNSKEALQFIESAFSFYFELNSMYMDYINNSSGVQPIM